MQVEVEPAQRLHLDFAHRVRLDQVASPNDAALQRLRHGACSHAFEAVP